MSSYGIVLNCEYEPSLPRAGQGKQIYLHKLQCVGLFGPVARNESTANSAIDMFSILAHPPPSRSGEAAAGTNASCPVRSHAPDRPSEPRPALGHLSGGS